jgi:hypothetical protein
MKKDNFKTDVIFRVDTTKDFKGQVFAVFPHDVTTTRGEIGMYCHVGQHSSADYNACISQSRPATEKEAKDLKNELENAVGYNLNVMKRRNYNKYLKDYYRVIEL